MGYSVVVDWAPAYELVASLMAFFSRNAKTLEIGASWSATVRAEGGDALAALEYPEPGQWLTILIRHCPEPRDVPGFLTWLGGATIGDLYTLLAPYAVPDVLPLPTDLGALRDRYIATLTTWDEHYFRRCDPAILAGLQRAATQCQAEVAHLEASAAVEQATGGVRFTAPPGVTQVVLVPQYHHRPFNLYLTYRGVRFFLYPADALPPAPGAPPAALLRLTRALDDESRLRILRLLATGQHTFTAIVQQMGLAKSTIHQHLVVLRAAGLVLVRDAGSGPESYALRQSAIATVAQALAGYVTPPGA